MQIMTDALNHFGFDHQLNSKLIGEIGELFDALGKYREQRATLKDIQSEIVDVLIIAEQVRIGLDELIRQETGEENASKDMMLEKLVRLSGRIYPTNGKQETADVRHNGAV